MDAKNNNNNNNNNKHIGFGLDNATIFSHPAYLQTRLELALLAPIGIQSKILLTL